MTQLFSHAPPALASFPTPGCPCLSCEAARRINQARGVDNTYTLDDLQDAVQQITITVISEAQAAQAAAAQIAAVQARIYDAERSGDLDDLPRLRAELARLKGLPG